MPERSNREAWGMRIARKTFQPGGQHAFAASRRHRFGKNRRQGHVAGPGRRSSRHGRRGGRHTDFVRGRGDCSCTGANPAYAATQGSGLGDLVVGIPGPGRDPDFGSNPGTRLDGFFILAGGRCAFLDSSAGMSSAFLANHPAPQAYRHARVADWSACRAPYAQARGPARPRSHGPASACVSRLSCRGRLRARRGIARAGTRHGARRTRPVDQGACSVDAGSYRIRLPAPQGDLDAIRPQPNERSASIGADAISSRSPTFLSFPVFSPRAGPVPLG